MINYLCLIILKNACYPSNYCSAEIHSPENHVKYQSLMGAVNIQFCLVGLNTPVQDSSVHGNFFFVF